MRSFKLDSGEDVIVKYAIQDIDGTNLEEGVDIFVEGDYVGSILGYTPNDVSEKDVINLMFE